MAKILKFRPTKTKKVKVTVETKKTDAQDMAEYVTGLRDMFTSAELDSILRGLDE